MINFVKVLILSTIMACANDDYKTKKCCQYRVYSSRITIFLSLLVSILQSFYFLMDIFPNTIGQMVSQGLITTICNVLQENMQYTDLAGQAAKIFIRISTETPEELLKSQAIQVLIQTYDF